jgi:hypothetical protein
MLFGLLGCGSQLSHEDAAVRHLKKTYGVTFHVEGLRRKDTGPFPDAYYSGYAYEEGKPLERFTVWVSPDRKTVRDTRYTVALLPAINGWVQSHADGIWADARTAVVVDTLSYNSRPDYGTDFMRFYQSETVNNTVLLILPDNADLYDRFCQFHQALDGVMTGYIKIYIDTQAEPQALLGTTPDAEIMIGSPANVIREKLKGL